MAKYRRALPQQGDAFFVTEGGIETTLIFQYGQELPHFAVFHLLDTLEGQSVLRKCFGTYGALARKHGVGLILETPTYRASLDWGAKMGYDAAALAAANLKSVAFLDALRRDDESDAAPVVIGGCVGPRGDGYVPAHVMTEQEAEEYHRVQVDTLAASAADFVSAITMNHAAEAIGIARAAERADIPVVFSLTVETDAHLPTGQALGAAVQQIDDATDAYPAYYMINCAHPTHFADAVRSDDAWVARIRGLRANASKLSHAELSDKTDLDEGDPVELGREYAALKENGMTRLNVMGGCCGTDHRHIEQMAQACLPLFRRTS